MYISFSIIIPTYHQPELLKRLLHQLKVQHYSFSKFEVIVVNNDPRDTKTRSLIKRLQARWPQLVYTEEKNRGASPARNRGVALARFSHLIFIDDDMAVQPTFLLGYDAVWQRYPQARIIGGGIQAQVRSRRKLTSEQSWLLEQHPWCFGQTQLSATDRHLSLGELVFSGNMSYKKRKNQKTVFHPHLGVYAYGLGRVGAEDYELSSRTLLQGEQVMFSVDSRLSATQTIEAERLTDEYVARRYYMAGLELALQERYLKRQFPIFRSFYVRTLLTWNGLTTLFQSRCHRIMVASYFLNGPLFFRPVQP